LTFLKATTTFFKIEGKIRILQLNPYNLQEATMRSFLRVTFITVMVILLVSGCASRKRRAAAEAEAPAPETEQVVTAEEGVEGAPTPAEAAPPTVPQEGRTTAAPGSDQSYVLNELNFEVKKLGAEVRHLSGELRDLQAKSAMWANPLTIYSKEIILDNGSTFYGKIVYQDEKILKVETLIGYLIIERASVVRIVENVPEQSTGAVGEAETPGMSETTTAPANRVTEPSYVSAQPTTQPAREVARSSFAPNVVLVGTINETKDRSGNLKLSGQVKNIGGRRADFVKLNFVFRQDWSGHTKTLTTFVKGSFNTFESGITSDASLLPGATGNFELYIPKSFGSFIGYSYTIDWEDYR
jgi:hypothetical protein